MLDGAMCSTTDGLLSCFDVFVQSFTVRFFDSRVLCLATVAQKNSSSCLCETQLLRQTHPTEISFHGVKIEKRSIEFYWLENEVLNCWSSLWTRGTDWRGCYA